MAEDSARCLRSDAAENRVRILDAATAVFAEVGPSASLVEIARRAGVGNATVHRNFTKEQLVEEVYADWFQRRLALAERALADPDAWHGFATFCEEVLANDGGHRSMGALFAMRPQWRECFSELMRTLLSRVQDAGEVRADLTVEDLVLTILAVANTMTITSDVTPSQWRRQLMISLDGMRTTRHRLPGLPITSEQLREQLSSWSAASLRTQ